MKRLFAVIFLTLFFSKGIAQQYYNDAQLWFNLYLEKKITKRFIIHLNQQDRWDQNISQFRLAYGDFGITYRFTKNVKVLADYVLVGKKKSNETTSIRHQYYIALVLKQNIRKWEFLYRNMLQVQYYDPYNSSEGFVPYLYDRNKVTVKYNLTKHFQFYVASELYLPLNNPKVIGFQRSRSFAGMFYNVTKSQQLELYFAFQAQLQYGDWFKQKNSYDNSLLKHDFIYGVGYSFSF